MSKKFKCAILTFALAGVVATSAAAAGCTVKTNHPCAKITVSFNEKEYEIEYKMYRNMYPQTVQHFIELADAGFYDNTIIHDYKSNDWVGGAYSYNAEVKDADEQPVATDYAKSYSSTALREYLELNSKEEQYYNLVNNGIKDGTFSASVYKQITYKGDKEQVAKEDALATLIGEFADNDHNIEKGALSASYGTLKMVYYDKGSSNQQVTIQNSFGEILTHDYKYNCATSLFAMQVGYSTNYSATKYCVFAELNGDNAKKALQNLTDAIVDYDLKTKSVTTNVDTHDTFAEAGGREIETSFTMTSLPLIVTSVKITKY